MLSTAGLPVLPDESDDSSAVGHCSEGRTDQTKMGQAFEMLQSVAAAFTEHPVLVVADSWFGNAGLWKPLAASGLNFNCCRVFVPTSRCMHYPLRVCQTSVDEHGKYGCRLGSTTDIAHQGQEKASAVAVFLYGKHR